MRPQFGLLMCAMAFAALAGCYRLVMGDCEDKVKSESVSPDGRYAATVVERDCGATTDYSTLVNLRIASEPLATSPESLILTLSGKQSIALDWEGNSQLTVRFPRVDTYTQKTSWKNVQVAYRHPD